MRPRRGPEPSHPKTRFGAKLIAWGIERDLSVAEQAQMIGVSPDAVITWRCRDMVPKMPVVLRQLEALGILERGEKPDRRAP